MTENQENIYKKYLCEFCNYNTSNKKDHNKHTLTQKHKRMEQIHEMTIQNPQNIPQTAFKIFYCKNCDKEFKSRV